jgi:hypothetical protein
MTPFPLRPPRAWQSAALPICLDALDHTRGVVAACTGAGKADLIAEVVAHQEGEVLVTAPTVDLVDQLSATIERRIGSVGRYYTHAKDVQRVTVVCHDSVPAYLERATPKTWIADEMHRSLDVPVARRLGFTATPYRSSGAGTIPGWDRVVFAYSIAEALRDGVLVDFRVHRGTIEDDRDAEVLRMLERDPPRGPWVASADSIADAAEFADRLAAHGYSAAAIHSRQPKTARRGLLADLEARRVDALAFPELLKEGVDLPWLSGVVLRRRVQRVGLIQTLGRVVRCHPGKTYADVWDPHDLLAEHGLTHTAALGDAAPEPEPAPDGWPLLDLPPIGRPVPLATAVDAIGVWAREMVLAMELGRDTAQYGTGWRQDPATPKQIAALERLKWTARFLPEEHRAVVNLLAKRAAVLRAGIASDLLDVLIEVARFAKPYRDRMIQTKNWNMKTPVVRVDVPFVPRRVVKTMEKA